MAKIIRFPIACAYTTLKLRRGSPYRVSVKILGKSRCNEARWRLQFAVQRAGSFRALRGFTDAATSLHLLHHFTVNRTWHLRRFLRDIESLVAAGQIVVVVNGTPIRNTTGIALPQHAPGVRKFLCPTP